MRNCEIINGSKQRIVNSRLVRYDRVKKIKGFMVIKFLSILPSRYTLIYNYIAKFLSVYHILLLTTESCFLRVIYE